MSAQWIWQRGWKDLIASIVGAHHPYDVQRDQDHAGSLLGARRLILFCVMQVMIQG
uniref:Uncharacterized protein n=1 Tax=mine drainage metagenome TaxID=410659 RepID=E6QA98_9ZZZZ